MRILSALLFLVPAICHALGAEDIEFYAMSAAGQVVMLKFIEDPKPWSRQNVVYGASGTKSLSLCWVERTNEVRRAFVCTASKGTAPTLVYEILGSADQTPKYDDKSPQAAEYRAIAGKARLGKGTERGDGVLEAIYVCKVGCNPDLPRHIYEIAKYD